MKLHILPGRDVAQQKRYHLDCAFSACRTWPPYSALPARRRENGQIKKTLSHLAGANDSHHHRERTAPGRAPHRWPSGRAGARHYATGAHLNHLLPSLSTWAEADADALNWVKESFFFLETR
ncbi:hypothetical protein EVAR_60430_1 [Eumeta japonica]|uniref:Uncharacterized protein n=1 Tax=Eumeta variegata TaxID=151549 RepID=A0A4C1ZND9_EUMVA|nr:hypothetical protein EVAR_60430_1 [Eumeta japonica]